MRQQNKKSSALRTADEDETMVGEEEEVTETADEE